MVIEISNKKLENLLKKYFKERKEYEWDDADVYVYKSKYSKPDGWGFYDDYYRLTAVITLTKKVQMLDEEYIITDKKYLNENEISDIMKDILKKDGIESAWISVDDKKNYLYLKGKELTQKSLQKTKKT